MTVDVNDIGKDKNVSVELITKRMLGKMVYGIAGNGHKFSSRLIAFDGENLYFENSKGALFIDKLSEIKHLESD